MDEFDEVLLAVLIDGKPRTFHQLLKAVDFSHNTLRLHLDQLVDQLLVKREKIPKTGRGRPVYTYSLASRRGSVASSPSDISGGVVSLPFRVLGQVCRFEKGGFCKKVRMGCEARNCPQISKWG
jgi:DNA-binding transcriptional ArsR family regulator